MSRANDFFGVDISDHEIKIVKLKGTEGSLKLEAYGEAELPSGAVEDGKVLRKKMAAETLRNLLENTKPRPIKSRRAMCNLPESRVFTYIGQFPNVERKKVDAEAIKWEMEKHFPAKHDELYWDWEVIGKQDDSLTVFVAATPREVVDAYLEVFELAGVTAPCFDIESKALWRIVSSSAGKTGQGVMVVDMGARTTTMTIFEGGSVSLSSSVPVAGNDLTEAIAEKMKVSFDKAEEIKRSVGMNPRKRRGRVFNILQSVMADVIVEIKNTISFYEKQDPGHNKIGQIIITGGSASLPDLSKYLKENLDTPLRLANPWTGLQKKVGKRSLSKFTKKKAQEYVIAFGVALRSGFKNPVLDDLNLAPTYLKRQYTSKAEKRFVYAFVVIFIIFVILFDLIFVWGWWHIRGMGNDFENQAQQAKVQRTSEEVQLEDFANKFNRQITNISKLMSQQKDWAGFWGDIDKLAGTYGVQISEMSYQGGSDVVIKGEVKTRENLLAFRDAIAALPEVDSVDSPISNLSGGIDNISFELTVTLTGDNQDD